MKHTTLIPILLLSLATGACDQACPSTTSSTDTGGGNECPVAAQCNATIHDSFCAAVNAQAQGLVPDAAPAIVAQCEDGASHCEVCDSMHAACLAEGLPTTTCDAAEAECNCYGTVFGVPLVADDGPTITPRNLPLPEQPDVQKAKVDSDLAAADILGECLVGKGRTALLSLEVLAGPDLDDWYPFRFALEGLAHHDLVACLRERVMAGSP